MGLTRPAGVGEQQVMNYTKESSILILSLESLAATAGTEQVPVAGVTELGVHIMFLLLLPNLIPVARGSKLLLIFT